MVCIPVREIIYLLKLVDYPITQVNKHGINITYVIRTVSNTNVSYYPKEKQITLLSPFTTGSENLSFLLL